MTTGTPLLVLALAVSVSGCAATKVYPICHYNGEGGTIAAKRDDIVKFIGAVAGADSAVAFAPNERLVAVRTTDSGHVALSKVWPRVGCLGQSRYDVEYKKYLGCVYMIEQAIKDNGLPAKGKSSDSVTDDAAFYCGLPLAALRARSLLDHRQQGWLAPG